MRASARVQFVIWPVVAALTAGVAWFAHGCYRAWHRYASEERFCGAMLPVIAGINEFHHATGHPPTNLTQLVPRYVSQFPAAPFADSIEYRVLPDGRDWQLNVHSRVTGTRHVFVYRSSGQFTPDEDSQVVASFHGWRGLKE